MLDHPQHSLLPTALRLLIICLALSLPTFSLAQIHKEDSLKWTADNHEKDSVRVRALITLSRMHRSDSLEPIFYKRGLEMAVASQDTLLVMMVEIDNAQSLMSKGFLDSAQHKVDSVLAILETLPEGTVKAGAHKLLGDIYKRKTQFDKCAHEYSRAATMYGNTGNPDRQVRVLYTLGVLYKNLSFYTQSLEVLLNALIIAERIGDEEAQSGILNGIGNTYKGQNNLEDALDAHTKALNIRLRLGKQDLLADSYNNIGLVYKKMGEFDQALYYFKKSLVIREKTKHNRGRSFTYNNIGLLFLDLGKPDSAIHYLNKSMKIKELRNEPGEMAIGYVNLGEAYLAKKDYKQAEEYYIQSVSLGEHDDNLGVRLEALTGLSELYYATGRTDDAYQLLYQHQHLRDSIFEQDNRRIIRELQASYKLQKSELEISQLEQQRRVQQLELQNYQLERNSFLIILGGIGVIGILLLMRFYSVNKFNKKLRDTNQELRETLVSNEEKETLLKEIHHRVKNNLQIITSLIRLQSDTINDPEAAQLFSEAQHRIKSMALVHEELYRTENFSSIDVREYIERLSAELIYTYALQNQVSVELHTDVDKLGINTLIPLGLILNEILTNALKHGFSDQIGKINISISTIGEKEYELIAEDNGKGFPEGIDIENLNSLGLDLIKTLTEQLDGTLELSNNPGARYTITFCCQD